MITIDSFDSKNFIATFAFDRDILNVIKTLPQRIFKKEVGGWIFPAADLFIFKKIVKETNTPYTLTERAVEQYKSISEILKSIMEMGKAKDTDYDIVGLKDDVSLYDFQKVGIQFIDKLGNALMGYDMGLGKSNPLDADLLSSNGWIKMGDVSIGDDIFGSDGKTHKVLGIFPQGKKKVYRVIFSDGSSSECCDEHLWSVRTPVQKYRKEEYRVKSLKEIRGDITQSKVENSKYYIPMVKPIRFKKENLTIDPYVLGCLLGDGGLSGNSVVFSTADNFLVKSIEDNTDNVRISQKNKYDYNICSKSGRSNHVKNNIKSLGLNVTSEFKFIPEKYKISSVNQRISMLQGLMDTDGGVDTKDGIVITYTSISERLVDDVRFLIESLGGVARKSSRITKYTYNGKKKCGKRSYRLNISLPSFIIPFRLPRKVGKFKPRTKYQPTRAIRRIEYVGEKECQCIKIDAQDQLYVTDHCILTHNTPIAISVISNAINKFKAKKNLIIVPASMKYQWGYQIAKFSDYSYTIVSGKDRNEQYRKNTDFIVVNYDLIYRDIDEIKDIEWDTIICDEIQRARNYKTDTFKALNRMKAKRRVGLTGTPLENDIMDLFTIMKFINPEVFGKNVSTFISRYCSLDFFGRIDHSKYRNLSEINKKLSFSMIRRKKRDVLDELPKKTENFFYINLNPTERKHYKEIKNGILEDIRSGKVKHVTTLSQIVYLRQLCDCLNLVITKDKVISSKFEEMKKIIDDLPKDQKIVIFTQYEGMAKIIEKNIGYKSVHLHGGLKNDCKREREVERTIVKENKGKKTSELDIMIFEGKKDVACGSCPYYENKEDCHTRKKIQYQFDNEEDIRIFISTDAGKAGIDLQVAPILINYDLSFNPQTNQQRIARIDRIGQMSENILIINFVCVDTIEERVMKIIEKKQSLFDQVVDGADEAESEKALLKKDNIKDIL